MKRNVRRYRLLVLLPALLVASLASMGVGCPKSPYRAALLGSDGVANGVHDSIVTIGQLYSQGKASDEYKTAAAKYLGNITDCNMTFRKAVVGAHTAGQIGPQAYLTVADAFVSCAQQITPPKGPTQNVFLSLTTAINGIGLAIQNAKGGPQ